MYKHWWFSGRILACHAGGPDSIPGPCVGANFLRVTILVSFPSINRTKSLWSIAFLSSLSFLGFWKIVVSTKRNFGSHKFWKKVFFALRSILFLTFFYATLLLCLAKVFGFCSVKFMKENRCPVQWSLRQCDNRTYCQFITLFCNH